MKICAIRIRCVPQARENSTTEITKIIVSYTHVREIVSLLVISSFSHWHFLMAAAVSAMWRHEQKWWPWWAPRLSVQTLDERDMRINMSNTVLGMCRSTPAHANQHQQHSDRHMQISTSNTVFGTSRSTSATKDHQQQLTKEWDCAGPFKILLIPWHSDTRFSAPHNYWVVVVAF